MCGEPPVVTVNAEGFCMQHLREWQRNRNPATIYPTYDRAVNIKAVERTADAMGLRAAQGYPSMMAHLDAMHEVNRRATAYLVARCEVFEPCHDYGSEA
jgi:hypothetical protein